MWEVLLSAALAFPNVQARDLDGLSVQTESLRGSPVVYLLGFTYESRHEVEAWALYISRMPGGGPRPIQMPVYGGIATFARPWIDRSMAQNTPREAHHNVLTTSDRDVLIKGLALSEPDSASATVLVDAQGQVRFLGRGAPTSEARARFENAWSEMSTNKWGK
jgi:hypothetical protein